MRYAPLTGKALRAYRHSTARFNIYEGAVRSSKTIGSILRFMKFCREGPQGALALIGKTERTAKRNVIDPMIEMIGAKRCRYVAGTGELYVAGRRIYVVGANNAEAVSKIQGLTLAGAYGDEITTWPEEFWNMLGTRMSVPGAQFFGTCNPAGPTHFLKDWLDRASLWLTHEGSIGQGVGDLLDLHRFSFTVDDNPHLPPDYVAALKAQYVGLFYRRYILGHWVPAEGAIFDMWDPERHVVSDIPTITRWLAVGVDHGTRNPFHAVCIGLGVDRRLHVVRDWRWDSAKRRRQLSDLEYSRELRQWLQRIPVPGTKLQGVTPERIVVDPSAKSFRVQLHHDGMPSVSADNDVLPGIRTLATLLATDMIDIHDSCEDLILEFPGYCWDDKAAQKDGTDKPIKLADHGLDGTRYGAHSTRSQWRSLLRQRVHVD